MESCQEQVPRECKSESLTWALLAAYRHAGSLLRRRLARSGTTETNLSHTPRYTLRFYFTRRDIFPFRVSKVHTQQE